MNLDPTSIERATFRSGNRRDRSRLAFFAARRPLRPRRAPAAQAGEYDQKQARHGDSRSVGSRHEVFFVGKHTQEQRDWSKARFRLREVRIGGDPRQAGIVTKSTQVRLLFS